MKVIRRLLQILTVFVLANIGWVWGQIGGPVPAGVLFGMLLGAGYLLIHIVPCGFLQKPQEKRAGRRIRILKGGYELILVACFAMFLQALWVLAVLPTGGLTWKWLLQIIGNCVLSFVLCFGLLVNAYVRVFSCSRQLRMFWKLAALFLWWVPVLNLFLAAKLCHAVRLEYQMEIGREELNAVRAENAVCRTKYPILMVHGIFFRDWQIFNYWGRIPKELMRNGATVYYGKQQSAQSVEASAKELKAQIERVLLETGAEKVNIIAHSKGGLDSRYAISLLGMDAHVASLTTINTPHLGCEWADVLLSKLPKGLIGWIAKRYNQVFTVLGDVKPDFYEGLMDLTAERCRELNRKMTDKAGVLYQSSMSVMKGMFSDRFPLWLSWFFCHRVEGANDGLVAVEASRWGTFLGTVKGKGKRGVSHGDVIDLWREDVPGYDVREYYVNLVADLKKRGF